MIDQYLNYIQEGVMDVIRCKKARLNVRIQKHELASFKKGLTEYCDKYKKYKNEKYTYKRCMEARKNNQTLKMIQRNLLNHQNLVKQYCKKK